MSKRSLEPPKLRLLDGSPPVAGHFERAVLDLARPVAQHGEQSQVRYQEPQRSRIFHGRKALGTAHSRTTRRSCSVTGVQTATGARARESERVDASPALLARVGRRVARRARGVATRTMQPSRDDTGVPPRVAAACADRRWKLPARFLGVNRGDTFSEIAAELSAGEVGGDAVRLFAFGLRVLEAACRASTDRKNDRKRWGFVHRCGWTRSGARDLDRCGGVPFNP